ncbi:MAG TPA: cupin domain-containing protein [Bryobacteraceae bacterium]|nr:cupin domain-containing protein [Bryobacteraceae bacterium]
MNAKNIREAVRFSPDKMAKVNLFETEHMFCDVYGLEPGQEQKAHAHQGSDKIYVVLSGQGVFRVGAEEHLAGPEMVILAPSGVEHGVRNPGEERLMLLVFMAPNPNVA